MLLICVSCREVWLLPCMLDSLVVTHTAHIMSASFCTCTQWLPEHTPTIGYHLHLHGLPATPQISWPPRSAPAVLVLATQNIEEHSSINGSVQLPELALETASARNAHISCNNGAPGATASN